MLFEYVRYRHILHRRLGLTSPIEYLFSPQPSSLREAPTISAAAAPDESQVDQTASANCQQISKTRNSRVFETASAACKEARSSVRVAAEQS